MSGGCANCWWSKLNEAITYRGKPLNHLDRGLVLPGAFFLSIGNGSGGFCAEPVAHSATEQGRRAFGKVAARLFGASGKFSVDDPGGQHGCQRADSRLVGRYSSQLS